MRTQFSGIFKARIVPEVLREEKFMVQPAAENGVHPTQLGKRKAVALKGLPSLFEERAAAETLKAAHEAQLTAEVAWLKTPPGLPPGSR